jgi:hypothetical protein
MNFIHRVACCCNIDPDGPDTGTPVTSCPPISTAVLQTISISVTANPKMYCPIIDHDCDPYEWCLPNGISGYPGTSCYGNDPLDPCGYTPVVAANSQFPTPVFSGTWGTWTASNGMYGGWDVTTASQPCPCVSFVQCADASFVVSPFSALSGSPQFKMYCTDTYDEWNSNPSDLTNNLQITVSDLDCCTGCECPTADYCSRITVTASLTQSTYIDCYVDTAFSGDRCDSIPYTGNISILIAKIPVLYQNFQQAICRFERKITTSQTVARLSKGAYTLRSITTANQVGFGINVDPFYSNPCTGLTEWNQIVNCPVGSELSDAGFTVTCTVS